MLGHQSGNECEWLKLLLMHTDHKEAYATTVWMGVNGRLSFLYKPTVYLLQEDVHGADIAGVSGGHSQQRQSRVKAQLVGCKTAVRYLDRMVKVHRHYICKKCAKYANSILHI